MRLDATSLDRGSDGLHIWVSADSRASAFVALSGHHRPGPEMSAFAYSGKFRLW